MNASGALNSRAPTTSRDSGTDATGQPRREHRPDESADRADPEGQPDLPGVELEGPAGEEDDDRGRHEREEVHDGRAPERRPQVGMPPQEPQSLDRPAPQPGPLGGTLDRRFVDLDRADGQRRAQERHRVDDHRHRRGERLDEQAAQGGTGDERPGPRGAQQRVRLQVLVAPDQPGEEGRVGGLVEHPARAEDQGDRIQQPHRHEPGHVRNGQHRDRGRLDEVRDDEEALLAALVVDPGADDEREQVGRPDRGGQHADLRRAGVQRRHRDERQRELGDAVAELRDGLAGPVRREPPVAPQRPGMRVAQRRHETGSSDDSGSAAGSV